MSTTSYQRPWRTVQHVDNKLSAPLAHRSACQQGTYQRPWHTVQHVDSKLSAPLGASIFVVACRQQVISALGTLFSLSTVSYQHPWRTIQHVDSKLSAPLAHRSTCRQQAISALGAPFSMSTA
ncbi:hypothetical protein KI387_019233, partial [Taxus chinensis]